MTSLLELCRDDVWFGELPAERQAALLGQAVRRRADDGARVYRIGDEPDGLYRVMSGEVRLISYPEVGRELVHLSLRPGRWFGELSVLDGGPRPHDAVAVGASVVLNVGMREIAALAAQAPALYRDLALLTCRHQRATLANMFTRRARPLRGRLAATLLDHAQPATDGEGAWSVGLSQEDLAGRVGVSRQSLSKALKGFEREALVRIAYRQIRILDRPALIAVGGERRR